MKRFLIVLLALLTITTAARSQTQADTSDAVWAIVLPLPASQDIDMKQALTGTSKDSVISQFMKNVGSWKFRVDSIYFRGTDAPYFSLVSGLPVYSIETGQTKPAEFRFLPTEPRVYQAEIVIETQAETLVQTIRGEGVQPQLEIISDWLDFGQVELGNENIISDTVLISNISNSAISINNVVQLGPDKEQFEILSGGGAFTLAPNDVHKMTIRFKPKYGGRTSGRIGFEYAGVGSPAVAQLFGMGIGGLVFVANDSAYAGEKRTLKLNLSKIKPEGIAAIASNFEAKIRFQSTILAPDNLANWTISNDSIYVTLKGTIGNTLELAPIPIIAGLGNTIETAVDVVEMYLTDNSGNKVDYDFELQSGNFKLLGICPEGGNRLIFPNSQVQINSVQPNPSNGSISVNFQLSESGLTELFLIDPLGIAVKTIFRENVSEYGNRTASADLNDLPSGQYLLILKTATVVETQKVMIIK